MGVAAAVRCTSPCVFKAYTISRPGNNAKIMLKYAHHASTCSSHTKEQNG